MVCIWFVYGLYMVCIWFVYGLSILYHHIDTLSKMMLITHVVRMLCESYILILLIRKKKTRLRLAAVA